MPIGCCRSFLRHGFHEEVTFEEDARMSWDLIRERARGREYPER